jgi:hypothetical protein
MARAASLDARYPLPDWTVDTGFKRDLTLAVAAAVGNAVEEWPDLEGPQAQSVHAERVTAAARAAIAPLLTWLEESPGDGVGYPGDPLVSYIGQLALTRPGEAPDPRHYRELLRAYSRHLARLAGSYRTRIQPD